jgi:hypothetical protein
MLNARLIVLRCAGVPESATAKVRVAARVSVGVPVIEPLAGSRLRPGGNVPLDTLQE